MAVQDYPPIEFVRQCLREENGHLFWLERPREHFATTRGWRTRNSRFAGKEAGYPVGPIGQKRYAVGITYKGKNRQLYRHVIIYALSRGTWVIGVDHENGNQTDDRIDNLRPATSRQNAQNSITNSNNTSGAKGVSWHKQNRNWTARVSTGREYKHVGSFNSIEDAKAAYDRAARLYHGEFFCDGTRTHEQPTGVT